MDGRKRPLSEEHKRKISLGGKGKKRSEETREKIRQSKLGKKRKPFSKEWLVNLSKAQKNRKYYKPKGMAGKTHSEETKKKMSKAAKGNKTWLGKKHSQQTKNTLREIRQGEKNPAWNGGISFAPYSQDWTESLKETIRQRDGYQCKLCLIKENKRKWPVHHIDYNKKNCSPDNLITLCDNCHSKTNHNRDYWKKYLPTLI